MNVTNLQLVLACATVLALLGALLWALVRVRTFNTLQAEHQALRQREQELISAIRASGGGQWEWDVRNRQLSFHGHFYAQFGLFEIPPEKRTAYWTSLRHPDDAARLADPLRQAMDGEVHTYEAELRVRDKNGQWRWVLSRGSVTQHGADGKPLRMVGMSLDVTARRATE